MKARLDHAAAAPAIFKAMVGLESALGASGLEHSLRELVKTRASQINGCAFCLEMHTREAVAAGEDPVRLNVLPGWRESPLFSTRERAALEWTEHLTEVASRGAPDDVFARVRAEFNDADLAALTYLIGTINVWNRMSVGFAVPHMLPARAAGAAA